ncbi:hypothetical protein NDN16_20625 [Aureimonas altamirensis]|uniref:hypothetical protein n=1 Tax=Aureimonas altamirensis TaxID=370622 RepID=UPI002037522B|nr:hypothetical protein [Aureimonas altamirensis]MCM2506063.1 hypothetical protein [Aureimonas altamirensis]
MNFEPESFWKQTPRTLEAIVNARNKAHEVALDRAVQVAHIGAYLNRVEKWPRLEKVLPSKNKKRKEQTAPQPWQQQLAIAKQWAAVFNKGIK